ncbi:NAD-dependent epimerase/dehydratase family protein [Saliphagus infecundisoli]|uniref:NAD-dependent epimerase/dehydratase family protein n=1 Tax=Saliphagus infecundisoli TaxID=1849069 RepID=A0ABD5QBL4_9EURY|nr:NAD(P)-dependent oxidoreductase [Saliphagus infecundisoli]
MALDTIAVTGGSGLIGSSIIANASNAGYRTANLDRVRPSGESNANEYVETDVLDSGDVYGALAHVDADAVIHMGTIRTPLNHPGAETFASNAMTSFHVLEAASALGLEAACLASSINALGFNFQDVPPEIEYLPVDEAHPTTPRDPYALGKRVTEEIADGFGRLSGEPETIATIRFPYVGATDSLRDRYAETDRSLPALREGWDPDGPSDDLFAYIHADDAARLAVRTVEAEFEGHETFWASAADTSTNVPTEELIEEFHPGAEIRRPFSGHESLVTTEKATELLGWEPVHSWRDI